MSKQTGELQNEIDRLRRDYARLDTENTRLKHDFKMLGQSASDKEQELEELRQSLRDIVKGIRFDLQGQNASAMINSFKRRLSAVRTKIKELL